MFSLRISLYNGSNGVIGAGGLFWHVYLEVFLKSLKGSSSKGGMSTSWRPSSESSSSGEGSWIESVGSALAKETSSWLGKAPVGGVLEEECFLKCDLGGLLLPQWFYV
jgi:hypothetical protein